MNAIIELRGKRMSMTIYAEVTNALNAHGASFRATDIVKKFNT